MTNFRISFKNGLNMTLGTSIEQDIKSCLCVDSTTVNESKKEACCSHDQISIDNQSVRVDKSYVTLDEIISFCRIHD